MFLARRPTPQAIDRFLRDSRDLTLSYAPVGMVRTESGATGVDEVSVVMGRGQADFERARTALLAWKQFDLGWVELFPRQAPIEVGTGVAVLIRHLGFWSLNGCRVLYTVGSVDDATRFGFAYGTLTDHAESGEELFEIVMDSNTGDVVYRIRAKSDAQAPLARLGHPFVRVLQKRFRDHSVTAMKLAVRSTGRPV